MMGLDVYSFIGWTICFFIFIFEGRYMVFAKNRSDKNDEIYKEFLKDKNRNNGYNVFINNIKKINDEYDRNGQRIPAALQSVHRHAPFCDCNYSYFRFLRR